MLPCRLQLVDDLSTVLPYLIVLLGEIMLQLFETLNFGSVPRFKHLLTLTIGVECFELVELECLQFTLYFQQFLTDLDLLLETSLQLLLMVFMF